MYSSRLKYYEAIESIQNTDKTLEITEDTLKLITEMWQL